MGRFDFVFVFCLREDFSDGTPVSLSLYSDLVSERVFVCVSMWYMQELSLEYSLFSISLPLSPNSTAFVLHSIKPLLQSGVEKRESGNFIIITSHYCNLYAMRTLRACSYNQVCRNHVRCFTNSWGDGSSSGGYGFPCC